MKQFNYYKTPNDQWNWAIIIDLYSDNYDLISVTRDEEVDSDDNLIKKELLENAPNSIVSLLRKRWLLKEVIQRVCSGFVSQDTLNFPIEVFEIIHTLTFTVILKVTEGWTWWFNHWIDSPIKRKEDSLRIYKHEDSKFIWKDPLNIKNDAQYHIVTTYVVEHGKRVVLCRMPGGTFLGLAFTNIGDVHKLKSISLEIEGSERRITELNYELLPRNTFLFDDKVFYYHPLVKSFPIGGFRHSFARLSFQFIDYYESSTVHILSTVCTTGYPQMSCVGTNLSHPYATIVSGAFPEFELYNESVKRYEPV